MIVRECMVSEIDLSDTRSELFKEYAEECALAQLPPPNPNCEIYIQLEAMGKLKAFGAWVDDSLIGYATVLLYHSPHYNMFLAMTESVFVAKSYRKTGAGIKLLKMCEDKAVEFKVPALLITAPLGGSLADILPHLGYEATNMIFLKKL